MNREFPAIIRCGNWETRRPVECQYRDGFGWYPPQAISVEIAPPLSAMFVKLGDEIPELTVYVVNAYLVKPIGSYKGGNIIYRIEEDGK